MRSRVRDPELDTSKPVLLLGGAANALSLMRSLGRLGIRVGAIMQRRPELLSRFCVNAQQVPPGVDSQSFYAERLLSGSWTDFSGAVVLACGDDAVEFVARNHRALIDARYIIERNDPMLQLALLDKAETLRIASQAGLPTPHFWMAEDIARAIAQAHFPVIVKPLNTHLHHARFGTKFRFAASPDSLRDHCDTLDRHEIPFIICEVVAGPDDRGCSYYTYRDPEGRELFHFTKRCIRRRPMNAGTSTYQITADLPDVRELAQRFFAYTRYTGLGNLEFKRDQHTGVLKVLECNTRFTAAQEQLLASGVDSDLIVYRDLTGQIVTPTAGADESVAIWWPFRDLQAFVELRSETGAPWRDWVRSLAHRRVVFPYFQASDPAPFLRLLGEQLWRTGRKVIGAPATPGTVKGAIR